MNRKRLVWILVIALLLAGTCQQWAIGELKRQAAAEKARADAIADTVAMLQQSATALEAALDSADAVVAAADSATALARAEAAQVSARARQTASAASARIRAALDSAGISTEALEAQEAAHAEEIAAKDEQIRTFEDERRVLFERIDLADSALVAERAVNAGLRQENEALRRSVSLLERAASPSIFQRFKDNLVMNAAVAGVSILAWEILGPDCSSSTTVVYDDDYRDR